MKLLCSAGFLNYLLTDWPWKHSQYEVPGRSRQSLLSGVTEETGRCTAHNREDGQVLWEEEGSRQLCRGQVGEEERGAGL